MIKINLLPIKEIKQKLRRRREFFFFLGSLMLVLLILLGINLALAAKTNQLQNTSDELGDQIRSYLALQREIKTLQENREALEQKIAAIEQLRVDSQLPVRILDEVSNRTPSNRIWLTTLRLTNNTLNLTGMGLDNPTVAQYMRALENSPYLANADLASSTQTEVDGQKMKSFVLAVTITVPPRETMTATGETDE